MNRLRQIMNFYYWKKVIKIHFKIWQVYANSFSLGSLLEVFFIFIVKATFKEICEKIIETAKIIVIMKI